MYIYIYICIHIYIYIYICIYVYVAGAEGGPIPKRAGLFPAGIGPPLRIYTYHFGYSAEGGAVGGGCSGWG